MKYIRKNLVFILSITAILFLSSCSIKPLEFSKINNVNIEPGNGFEIAVDLTFYNPNRVKLALDDIDIDVYLGDLYLGKLEAPDVTTIERKGNFSTKFKVKVKKQNMLVLGGKLISLAAKNKVEINLKGSIKLEHWLVKRKIDINHTETVKL